MPTRRATWLPLAPVVANGLLVGVNLDQSIKQFPARHRIGVTAFAADLVLQRGVVTGLVPWWLTGWRVRHPAPPWPGRRCGWRERPCSPPARSCWCTPSSASWWRAWAARRRSHRPGSWSSSSGPTGMSATPCTWRWSQVIIGQALLLGQPGLLGYAAAVGGATAAFAHGYEEPTLCRQFGAQYEAYRRAVPAWWPRRHPWQPGQAARHET